MRFVRKFSMQNSEYRNQSLMVFVNSNSALKPIYPMGFSWCRKNMGAVADNPQAALKAFSLDSVASK
jgi:hypothetical protein